MTKYVEREEQHLAMTMDDAFVFFLVWFLDFCFMLVGIATNSFVGGVVFSLAGTVGLPLVIWILYHSTETRIVKIKAE